ncbi:hypothetical protein NQ317_008393 [Molorchus minor]|uniref:Transmembrane protein 39A n=1 Tax=Molorchus minor TaxID=1323400 RepID=A0ABQ9K439_9CUCU|nr:hypothetical protein NQ317_008393 [Molorchus minor]
MPGGTKRISRVVRTTTTTPVTTPAITPIIPSFANEPCEQRYTNISDILPPIPIEQPPAPKHFPFPNTPVDDDLFFEFLLWFFSVVAAGLQYLHLYRTVWWLPYSYTKRALNFYLIDPYLVIFIFLILTRRLVYMLGCRCLDKLLVAKAQDLAHACFRSFLFGVVGALLAACAYFVMKTHPTINMLYLCYPVLVYLILFGLHISPFFELGQWTPSTMPPLHACCSNAAEIRREGGEAEDEFQQEDETDTVWCNSECLLCRVCSLLFCAGELWLSCITYHLIKAVDQKQVNTQTCEKMALHHLNAVFGFISALHYDTFWSTQHVIFIFLSSFVALSLHILPLRYCDILHRSALHLGMWEKMDTGRSVLLINIIWKADVIWPYGTVVRYGRNVWCAKGDYNSSEPGNTGLKRFYYIFKNPTCLVGTMLLVHLLMVLYQLVLLCRSNLWYHIISLAFILFFNYYILYKICRDYLVSYKLYLEERDMHKKINVR